MQLWFFSVSGLMCIIVHFTLYWPDFIASEVV